MAQRRCLLWKAGKLSAEVTEGKILNFLCTLMEECNSILHGEDSSLDIGDTRIGDRSRMQGGDCQPLVRSTERWDRLFAWSLPPSFSLMEFENYQTCPTLSHFLSLVRRMITNLGCIWYPSSLNDKFLPSKVTLIRYLQETEKSKENVNAWERNAKQEPASHQQLSLGW